MAFPVAGPGAHGSQPDHHVRVRGILLRPCRRSLVSMPCQGHSSSRPPSRNRHLRRWSGRRG